jgi:hypothetical protein
MDKPDLEETDANEMVQKIRATLFKTMEGIDQPIIAGHGDLITKTDEKKIKRDIEFHIMSEIKLVYNVLDC